jgi:SEC-C motif-containing protein
VAAAPTAEALMRSRYCAFALGDAAYLLVTWHPSTRPEPFELDADLRWTRLDIERTVRGGPFDTDGVVEFTAYCRNNGTPQKQHEVSRFVKLDRRWVYLDGLG